MPIKMLAPTELRLIISPDTLGFGDTSELVDLPLPWIGQARAEKAAHFGLSMAQPDYNLFVLGEIGSGRSSLLKQAMQVSAAKRSVPPDLCYLHNFDTPEKPLALRLPAGQGRQLRELMLKMTKSLQIEIPQRLERQDFKAESERIIAAFKEKESKIYQELEDFSDARSFSLRRDGGRLVFTLLDEKGGTLTEDQVVVLPKERRASIEQAEQELRSEITRYFEKTRPLEKEMNEALAALRRQVIKPLIEHELQEIRNHLKKQIKDATKLNAYFEHVQKDILEHLELFKPLDTEDDLRLEALTQVLTRHRINLVVDNDDLRGAPVIVEENPTFRTLFGCIEYQSQNDMMTTDFTRIRAGSLLRAHGGFLLLHLRDLFADPSTWEKLRRFLRSGRLQIDEPGMSASPITTVTLDPEAVDVNVKIILIGSRTEYYELQEADPEFARRFRIKVDFAESFVPTAETRRDTGVFIAHTCREFGLPHFTAAAVARILEESHREVDDQARQSSLFSHIESLVMESAAIGHTEKLIGTPAVEAALAARMQRHDYPEQRIQEAFAEGDLLITVHGEKIGQMNALSQVDLGDHRFGFPGRVSARTFAGEDGLLNLEREVEMSGPIHDKGVLILQHYLAALFAHLAPLALNASIVFEQEYGGVEGDSASCAELYVLLSSLSGLPIRQGIAVTGALNQHGEILPIGGLNEKIEGYFHTCLAAGLDGTQGVLIPHRNLRHLMLSTEVVDAVRAGRFNIYTAEHVSEGIEFLMGMPTGVADAAGNYPHDSVLGLAQKTLINFRRACQSADHKAERKSLR